MSRLPVWLAVGFLAGVVLGDRFEPDVRGLRAAACGCAVLAPLLARRPRAMLAAAVALAMLLGASAIAARLAAARAAPVAAGLEWTAAGRPCGAGPTGTGLVLCGVRSIGRGAPAPPIAARWLIHGDLEDGSEAALRAVAGAPWIRARVLTTPAPEARNPGARDRARGLARRGIGGRARLVDRDLVVAVGEPARFGARTRARASAALASARGRLAVRLAAAGRGGPLLAALGLGDRTVLDPATRAGFARLGIAHLLAVSGLHVALVAGLGFALARRALARPLIRRGRADPRPVALAVALLLAAGYALLAGFGVPLRRALIAACLIGVAFGSGRRGPVENGLAVAALAIAVDEPAALFEPGAQLSFVAVAVLLRASAPVGEVAAGPVAGGRQALRRSIHTSALAVAATAPVLASHGFPVTLVGLAANLVAVPLTAVVLLPSALLAVGVAAFGPGSHGDGVLAALAGPAWGFVAAVEGLASPLPLEPPLPPPGLLSIGLAAVAVAMMLRTPRGPARVLAATALVAWLGAAPRAGIAPAPPRLVALAVGQGDALLVQGRLASVLVDGGRAIPGRLDVGARVVVPALAALGVGRLDAVVATHADLDHRGGLEAVLRAVVVERLWLPPGGRADPDFAALRHGAARGGTRVEEVAADGRVQRIGDLAIELLWPVPGVPVASRNDGSIVARVRVADDAVLLTGDVGAAVERVLLDRGRDVGARILKVAHHGSRTSSTPAFVQAVDPGIVLVSAGCRARGGLPDADVLARLARDGRRVLWTGRDGALVIPLGAGREREAQGVRTFGAPRSDCVRRAPRPAPVDCVARPTACD